MTEKEANILISDLTDDELFILRDLLVILKQNREPAEPHPEKDRQENQ